MITTQQKSINVSLLGDVVESKATTGAVNRQRESLYLQIKREREGREVILKRIILKKINEGIAESGYYPALYHDLPNVLIEIAEFESYSDVKVQK